MHQTETQNHALLGPWRIRAEGWSPDHKGISSLFTEPPPGPCRLFQNPLCSLRCSQHACSVLPLGREDFEAPQGACICKINTVASHIYLYSRMETALCLRAVLNVQGTHWLDIHPCLTPSGGKSLQSGEGASCLCTDFVGVSFREQVYVRTMTIFTFVYFVHNI